MSSAVFQIDSLLRNTFVAHAEAHVEIGSTNDRALELCRDARLPLPALVVAERQTAGRGRRGAAWWSPDGALMFSLIVAPSAGDASRNGNVGLLALAAAAGVADAVDEMLGAAGAPSSPEHRVSIKWPNDVLIGDRKAAGILVEAPHIADSPAPRLVIGVGLNLNNRSETAASLGEAAGREFDLQQMLVAVLRRLEKRLDEAWRDEPALVASLRERCSLTGRHVEVATGQETIAGECRGVAADGGLIVATDGGLRTVYSGTVVKA